MIMSTEHAAFSFYRAWVPRNAGILPVSVSDRVEAQTSTSECRYIMYECQRTQQIVTECHATATKHVDSIPMPQLNRHLISFDRSAVANERTTAVIPWKWKQNCQILWRSSAVLKLAMSQWFSNKKRQCEMVA